MYMDINSAWKKPEFQLAQKRSLSHILLTQSQCSIVFKLMTMCSKISWFVSGEQIFQLRQIIVLRDTDKSRYFAITMFNNIIVLSFDHQVYFLMNIFGKQSNLPVFTQEWSQGGEKCGFIYVWAQYYLQPNTVRWHCTWVDHYYFVCSYLHVTWWAFGQWKGRTICIEW